MRYSLLLLLACFQVSGQSGYTLFSSGQYMGIKGPDGKELVAPVYDLLGWTSGGAAVSNGFIGYQEHDKWGLLTVEGKRVTPPVYDKIEPLPHGGFKVGTRGKFTNLYLYGIIDEKGKLVVSQAYFSIDAIEDILVITTFENNQFRLGALSSQFRKILDVAYEAIDVVGKALIVKKPSGYFAVFDHSGKLVLDDLVSAKETRGYIHVVKNGAEGLVSHKAEIIHQPIYKSVAGLDETQPFPKWKIFPGDAPAVSADSIRVLGPGIWFVHTNGIIRLYSKQKLGADNYRIIQLDAGLAIVQAVTDNRWHTVDQDGQIVLSADDSIAFDGQLLFAKEEKFWRIFNKKGVQLVSRTFDQIQPFGNGYAAVKKYGYWAIFDVSTNELSDFRYDQVRTASSGGYVVQYVGNWGVFHPQNGWLLNPVFDQIIRANDRYIATRGEGNFLYAENGTILYQTIDKIVANDGYFILRDNGHVSAMTLAGRSIANTEYASVKRIGDFFQLKKGDTTELYSPEGKRVVSKRDRIDDVLAYNEGMFLIRTGNTFGFIDHNGKLRIANRYDSASAFSNGLAAVKLRNRWGFINQAEQLVIQPHYDWVSSFSKLAIFRIRNVYGLVDAQGNERITDMARIYESPSGNFILQSNRGLYGLANADGRQLLSPVYDFIEDIGENRIIVQLNQKKGVVDYAGKVIIPFEYGEIQAIGPYLLLKTTD